MEWVRCTIKHGKARAMAFGLRSANAVWLIWKVLSIETLFIYDTRLVFDEKVHIVNPDQCCYRFGLSWELHSYLFSSKATLINLKPLNISYILFVKSFHYHSINVCFSMAIIIKRSSVTAAGALQFGTVECSSRISTSRNIKKTDLLVVWVKIIDSELDTKRV